jgi:hypothetical protein
MEVVMTDAFFRLKLVDFLGSAFVGDTVRSTSHSKKQPG